MLNRAIRIDDALGLVPAVIVASAINIRRNLFRSEAMARSRADVQSARKKTFETPFPRNGICYRGLCMDTVHSFWMWFREITIQFIARVGFNLGG